MKKLLTVLLITSMLFAVSACSSGSNEAKSALEAYLNCIKDKDYETAYEYLSDFDKDNITKELFISWRTAAAKVQTTKSYTISSKVDKFKDYKYLGTTLGDTFGFEVKQEVQKAIPDIELKGYDEGTYHIMVAADEKDWKVALLLTNLEELVKKLNATIEEKEKAIK